MIIKPLPSWALINRFPSFYEGESLTAIEQTARVYGKMGELIESYNKYVELINTELEEFESQKDKDYNCFVNTIIKLTDSYITQVDLRLDHQDRILDENYKAFTDHVLVTIENMIQQLKESGEMDQIVLNAVANLSARFDVIQSTYAEELAALREDYETTKTNLQTDYDTCKTDLERNYTAALSGMGNSFNNERQKLEQDYESIKSQLGMDYGSAKSGLNTQYEETKARLESEYSNATAGMRNLYDQTAADLQADYTEVKEDLTAKHTAMTQENAEFKEEIRDHVDVCYDHTMKADITLFQGTDEPDGGSGYGFFAEDMIGRYVPGVDNYQELLVRTTNGGFVPCFVARNNETRMMYISGVGTCRSTLRADPYQVYDLNCLGDLVFIKMGISMDDNRVKDATFLTMRFKIVEGQFTATEHDTHVISIDGLVPRNPADMPAE